MINFERLEAVVRSGMEPVERALPEVFPGEWVWRGGYNWPVLVEMWEGKGFIESVEWFFGLEWDVAKGLFFDGEESERTAGRVREWMEAERERERRAKGKWREGKLAGGLGHWR